MTPEVIPIFFKKKAIMGVKHSQEYVIAFSPVLLAFHSLILNHLPSFFFWMSRVPFSALWLTASLELRLTYMPQPSTLLMSPKFLSPEFQIIFILCLAAQHYSSSFCTNDTIIFCPPSLNSPDQQEIWEFPEIPYTPDHDDSIS